MTTKTPDGEKTLSERDRLETKKAWSEAGIKATVNAELGAGGIPRLIRERITEANACYAFASAVILEKIQDSAPNHLLGVLSCIDTVEGAFTPIDAIGYVAPASSASLALSCELCLRFGVYTQFARVPDGRIYV